MFLGEYKHTIDAKGRLFIPAKFRDKLEDGFILSKGVDECIRVYPVAEWQKFVEKLEQIPSTKGRHILRFFYSGADEGSIDSQGRVTVNQMMRAFAKLEKEVMVVGLNSYFEIWAADAWEATRDMTTVESVTNDLEEWSI